MHYCPSCTKVHCTELEKSAFSEPLVWVRKVHFMGLCNDVWGKYSVIWGYLKANTMRYWIKTTLSGKQKGVILTNTTFGWNTVVFKLPKEARHIFTTVRASIQAYFPSSGKVHFPSFGALCQSSAIQGNHVKRTFLVRRVCYKRGYPILFPRKPPNSQVLAEMVFPRAVHVVELSREVPLLTCLQVRGAWEAWKTIKNNFFQNVVVFVFNRICIHCVREISVGARENSQWEEGMSSAATN